MIHGCLWVDWIQFLYRHETDLAILLEMEILKMKWTGLEHLPS